jgi:argininosuccinate lyase
VQKLAMPFREAHEITGKIVSHAAANGKPLHRLSLAEMQGIDKRIPQEALEVLSVARSVASRTSYGGTAPKNVRVAARKWLKRLGK